MKHPSKIRILEPVILFVVIGVLIVYVVNALNTQDWWWFRSQAVEVVPSRMVIVQDGERTTLVPGSPMFDRLAEAAQISLSHPNNTDLINLGISDDTLAFYESSGVLLELYFDRPVQFHTSYRTGEPTQLLVPIEGRHAGNGYFFRGDQGEWWFGAMRMADPAPLLDVMAALGYRVDRGTAVSN
jgi:hypothetical protein